MRPDQSATGDPASDVTATGDTAALPATTLTESWTLLRQGVIGRLAVLVDGAPDIFPVNYAVDHGSIVFRTATGTKRSAARHGPCAFEVDGYDAATGEAWSVVAKGTVHEVHDVDEVIDLLGLALQPWHGSTKPHLMRFVPETVSGRRFPVTPAARPSGPGATGAS